MLRFLVDWYNKELYFKKIFKSDLDNIILLYSSISFLNKKDFFFKVNEFFIVFIIFLLDVYFSVLEFFEVYI